MIGGGGGGGMGGQVKGTHTPVISIYIKEEKKRNAWGMCGNFSKDSISLGSGGTADTESSSLLPSASSYILSYAVLMLLLYDLIFTFSHFFFLSISPSFKKYSLLHIPRFLFPFISVIFCFFLICSRKRHLREITDRHRRTTERVGRRRGIEMTPQANTRTRQKVNEDDKEAIGQRGGEEGMRKECGLWEKQ